MRDARSMASCNRRDSWSRYRGILAITIFIYDYYYLSYYNGDIVLLAYTTTIILLIIIYISYYCHFIYYLVVRILLYVWRTPSAHRIKYYRASTLHTLIKKKRVFFVRAVMYLKLSSCTRAVCFKRTETLTADVAR